MSIHELVAPKFAEALVHPSFFVLATTPYISRRTGQPGVRWEGQLDGRCFYISESRTASASPLHTFARVLLDPSTIDREKSLIYDAHQRLGIGIRIEAWHRGRWYHIFTPVGRRWPRDFFSAIIRRLLGE